MSCPECRFFAQEALEKQGGVTYNKCEKSEKGRRDMDRKKRIPIGIENFKEMVDMDYYFVDKTLMIRDLLDQAGKVNLFTRPRRFGKTLNLSMLRYYFEDTGDAALNEEHRRLFDGLAISDAGERYTEEMQRYPVIFLTLKSAKQISFEYSFGRMKESIAKEFARHENAVTSTLKNAGDVEKYQAIRGRKADDAEYYTAIAFLSDCLYEVYGKKCILLLDEYDVPLENAYFQGFYGEMIAFIRSLFESVLKTNDSLQLPSLPAACASAGNPY